MALGGGSWVTQNKILPGSYISFASLAKASETLSDRGIAAAPFILSWGPESTVLEVTVTDFQKNSKKIFGYDCDAPEMLALREIFRNASKVYCYRLGTGTKASNDYAEAKYGGTRGNDLIIKITKNVDDDYFTVTTVLDGSVVDEQQAKTAADLIANDFVTFKSKDVTLSATAGTPLTGGADCTSITGTHYQGFLDAIESYSFNTLCCPVNPTDSTAKSTVALFVRFTQRMRDEIGAKFQLCAIRPESDYMGGIGVWNTATTAQGASTDALVYWVTGASAAVAVNKALTNSLYNGELVINTDYTQTELESAIKAGKFMLHSVNGEVRVLEDINTLVTFNDETDAVFCSNQTVRICDQIANDVATLFNTRYVGQVPNDASGRAALWNDVVKIIQRLEEIRAVNDFDSESVIIDVGDSKGAVLLTIDSINLASAMSQLYMRVIIK